MRCRINLLISHPALARGYEEVNDKVVVYIKEGESFSLGRWLPIYRGIFEDVRLNNEAYEVAGLVYLGMALRQGDLGECRPILAQLDERLVGAADAGILRGLVRERRRLLEEYVAFTEQAATWFMAAIEKVEFNVDELPYAKLAVAECLRRLGDLHAIGPDAPVQDQHLVRALEWYVALARMQETKPAYRVRCRQQGAIPAAQAPTTIMLGWIADGHIAKRGLTSSGRQAERVRALLGDGPADWDRLEAP